VVEGALIESLEQRETNVSLTNLLTCQTHRSPYLLYPFYTMMLGSLFLSTWGMCRMVLVSTDFSSLLDAPGLIILSRDTRPGGTTDRLEGGEGIRCQGRMAERGRCTYFLVAEAMTDH
jgi:hypothetical protein